jgi:hypothetical protein
VEDLLIDRSDILSERRVCGGRIPVTVLHREKNLCIFPWHAIIYCYGFRVFRTRTRVFQNAGFSPNPKQTIVLVGKSAGRLMNTLIIIISFSDGTQFFKHSSFLISICVLVSSVDMRGIYTYSCDGGVGEQFNEKTSGGSNNNNSQDNRCVEGGERDDKG